MSAPDLAAQIRDLAALAGGSYDSSKDPDVLRIALIASAKASGVTWAQIGQALLGRADGKAAKKHVKALAHTANTKLIKMGLPGVEVPQ